MADLEDDFAAGLETEPTQVVETQVSADPVLEWAKSQFDGLPDDATPDGFADAITEWQTKAAKATEYEQKIAEYEAMIQAQHAAQQQQQAAAPQQAAPVETPTQAAQRRFEAIKLDAALAPYLTEQYVEVDQYGMFKPKMMVPQVMTACDLKNKSMIRQREIGEALTTDLYGTIDEGFQHSNTYQQLQTKLAELEARFEQQVAPLRKSAEELAAERFLYQNQNLLYAADPANPQGFVPTPAGELYGTLVSKGMSPDDALEIAKTMSAKLAPPAAPAAPKQKPARFVAPIVRRMNGTAGKPTERRPAAPLEVATNNFAPTWDEIANAVKSIGDE